MSLCCVIYLNESMCFLAFWFGYTARAPAEKESFLFFFFGLLTFLYGEGEFNT